MNIIKPDLAHYRKQGFCFLRHLISPAQASALRDEVLGLFKGQDLGQSKLTQLGDYAKGSGLDKLIHSPQLNQIASLLMEGPARIYLPFTAIKGAGGGGKFHFHQDNQYTRFNGPGINIWFALEEMSPRNGCLRIVPRSHYRGTLPSRLSGDGDQHQRTLADPSSYVECRMDAGDAVAFSRLTVHASGINTSAIPRVGYGIQFHREDVWAQWGGDVWRLLRAEPRWKTGPMVS